jgi:thioredoxin reductase (NADPH)
MPRPALLAVDGDPAAKSAIERELRKRYGADYEVVCEASGAAALGTLKQIGARGGQVVLVLADLRLPDMPGPEPMTRVHGLDPAARRALLTNWGDMEVGDRLVRGGGARPGRRLGPEAVAAGRRGLPPAGRRAAVRVAQLHRSGFEAVQVVGEQWSARAHELRDVLARNKVRYGFLPADSEAGRELLGRVGATAGQLPVVVTFDGLVLRNPPLSRSPRRCRPRPARPRPPTTWSCSGPARPGWPQP